MSEGYFTTRLDHSRGYIDLWRKPELEQEQARSMCQFMSVGLGGLQRYRAKQLEKAIMKRNKGVILKFFRPLALNRKFLGRIQQMLERSGLPLSMQMSLSRKIRRLLLDFIRDRHTLISMSPGELNSLPNDLRQFVIALIVLKAEIANLYRLERERENYRNHKLLFERPRITKLSREKPYNQGLEHHREFATGVSLTAGEYSGMRGYALQQNRRNRTYKKGSKDKQNLIARDNKKTFYRAWNNQFKRSNTI